MTPTYPAERVVRPGPARQLPAAATTAKHPLSNKPSKNRAHPTPARTPWRRPRRGNGSRIAHPAARRRDGICTGCHGIAPRPSEALQHRDECPYVRGRDSVRPA